MNPNPTPDSSETPELNPLPLEADIPVFGRDELNLAEFPLASLGDRIPAGLKSLQFEDQIRDSSTGEVVTRRLTVSASDQHGLPTALDDDVIVALIQITRSQNSFTDRSVAFSRYQLLQLLGWPDKGQSYDRLEESLKRWLGVTLYYEKAWWDKEEKSWVDEHFHIIDNVTLYDKETRQRKKKKNPDAALPLSSFSWNQVIFRSFQAENLKKLDLETYFSLSLAPTKRMYRFLDKRFYRRIRWEFDLREFACEHIGFARSYDNSQLRRKMIPAIEELEAIGFLEPLPADQRFIQVRRGEWRVLFLKKLTASSETKHNQSALRQSAEQELLGHGVTATVAAELVASHPIERIRIKLEVFDWLLENKDARVSKNPAGYLVKSIRDDFTQPTGFETKDTRETKKHLAQQRQEKRQQAERERQAEEDARQARDTAPLDAYYQKLNPQEQATLYEVALAAADPWLRDQAKKTGVVGDAARKQILHQHIRTLLPESEFRGETP